MHVLLLVPISSFKIECKYNYWWIIFPTVSIFQKQPSIDNCFYPKNLSPSNSHNFAKSVGTSNKSSDLSPTGSNIDKIKKRTNLNATFAPKNDRESSAKPKILRNYKKCSGKRSTKRKSFRTEKRLGKSKSSDNPRVSVGNSLTRLWEIGNTYKARRYVAPKR